MHSRHDSKSKSLPARSGWTCWRVTSALRHHVSRCHAPAQPPLVATMPICTIELLLEVVLLLLLLLLALAATLSQRRS